MGNVEEQIIKCNKDPIGNECEKNCKIFKECWEHHMKFDVRIPFFIVDKYLPILSRHATNILLFLSRRVNFSTTHRNFGRCWATHKQIAEGTNVPQSNIKRYIRELANYRLLTKTTTTGRKDDGTFYKVNTYSVTWFKRVQELQVALKSGSP